MEARATKAVNAGYSGSTWRRVVALLGPKIFKFCGSKAVEDHGIVSFLKLWAELHRFKGLGRRSFERSWLRLGGV